MPRSMRLYLFVIIFLSWFELGCGGGAGATSGGGTDQNPNPGTAQISVSTTSLAFGSVTTGSTQTLAVTLTNSGTAALEITAVTLPAGPFTISNVNLPLSIAAGSSRSINVSFSPTSVGSATATITVTSSAGTRTVALSGTGAAPTGNSPVISVTPASLDYGSVVVSQTKSLNITVSNTGSAALSVTSVTSSASAFSVQALGLPLSIAAGSSQTVAITYAPTSTGSSTGTITFASNGGSATVSLKGSATQTPAPHLTVTPASVNLGTVPVSATVSKDVTLTNDGTANLTINSVELSGAAFQLGPVTLPATIAPTQSMTLTVSGNSSATGQFSGALTIGSTDASSPAQVPVSMTAAVASSTSIYISPTGNDSNAGTLTAPVKTFAKAFSLVSRGGEVILLDGTYTEATTGIITSYPKTAASAAPPSGFDKSHMTTVRALNEGSVKVVGRGVLERNLFLGNSTTKISWVKIQGITFDVGNSGLYNTDHVYIKNCGFHNESNGQTDNYSDKSGVFDIGTNDHNQGNTNNLIEDSWVWGKARVIVTTYRADRTIWRRVVVRGDGCTSANCTGSGNPNFGINPAYNSTNSSVQNVIVVDRIRNCGADCAYGDFGTAMHSSSGNAYGNVEFLGVMSVKSPDVGIYPEPDAVTLNTPAHRIKDCVVIDPGDNALNVQGGTARTQIENCTIRVNNPSVGGVYFGDGVASGSYVKNSIVFGTGAYAAKVSGFPITFMNVNGTWSNGAYAWDACSGTGCKTSDPLAGSPAALMYPTRVEAGSALSGTAENGADYGANVTTAYGVDGTFYDDPGYNTKTSNPLWPWPNEARIKQDMCASSGVTRGFCSAPSLTEYIWGLFGNPAPATF